MFIPTRWNMRLRHFAQDEEGAQVIEYALIIAMTSITLALILRGLSGGTLTNFITRVSECLTDGACT